MWGSFATTLLILLLLVSGYSFLIDRKESKTPDISLSQLSADIKAGLVAKVLVKGEKLDIAYADETKKSARKEVEASLSETLTNYGLSPKELSTVEVLVEDPTGFGYWFATLAPFLIPILFILFFFWFFLFCHSLYIVR